MAIVTAGYDGTVDEVQFSALLHRYSVVGADDFKATTQAGDRIVAIADGVALGPGTRDVATAIPNIQFAAATGTRWDLVVLRRDWQPPGGATTVTIVQGGSSKGYPVVGTAATDWNRRPGILDDQPLYLQEVVGTSLGTRIDLRCWAGHNGLTAVHEDARTYLQRVGTEILINGTKWTYALGDNNVPGWVSGNSLQLLTPLQVTGYSLTGTVGIETLGATSKRVTVDMNVTRTGATTTIPTSYAAFGAALPTAARGSAPHKYIPVSLSGGGSTNVHATVFLNPVDGTMSIRGQSAFTWETGALCTVNVAYYI